MITRKTLSIISLLIFISIIVLPACSPIDVIQRGNSNNEIEQDDNIRQISLFTYNIEAISSKSDDQIDKFVSYINKREYDFVVLQELFNESTRDEIVEKSNSNHYKTVRNTN